MTGFLIWRDMPIPKPNTDESQEEFINRCMADEVMQEYDQEQRAGICHSQWENRKQHPHGNHICICPDCDKEITVEENIECRTQKCPDCGTQMRAKETGVNRDKQGNNMEKKSLQIQLKQDTPGAFVAKIATLNVIDSDHDVTLPGAFPEGKTVLVSAYQHGSWGGMLPVGKAAIHEIVDEVVAEGQFNLSTASGKEHYEAIKFSGDLQEWSYGFQVMESEPGKQGDMEVRFLKKVDVFEISPVLKGAGIGTQTMSIKAEKKGAISYNSAHPDGTPKSLEDAEWDAAAEVAAASVGDLKIMCTWVDSENADSKGAYKLSHHKSEGQHTVVWKAVAASMGALMGARGGVDLPAADRKAVYNHLAKHYSEFDKEPPEFRADIGATFTSEFETALAVVENVAERTKSLANLRRKEGRTLSIANRERIGKLLEHLSAIAGDLTSLLASTEPDKEKARQLYLEFSRIHANLFGGKHE